MTQRLTNLERLEAESIWIKREALAEAEYPVMLNSVGNDPAVMFHLARTDLWKTRGLKQALNTHSFDVAFSGARRDEERSRTKEHIFSFRSASQGWHPKSQRPEKKKREGYF